MKIQNTSEVEAGKVKIVIAGEAGNGKTTLARTIQEGLKERVLVISAEAGLLSLKGTGIDFIELQRKFDDQKKEWVEVSKVARIAYLAEVYDWLLKDEQKKRYQWVFIDSLTEIGQNMLEFLESLEEYQGPKNNIKKYGELATRMRSLCKTFRDMPHYNICFSALVKEETDSDNQKQVKVALTGAFADQLPALFDCVLYLGVMPDVDDQGRNVRKILTQKTPKHTFPKDRSGTLLQLEPADLSVIVRKIRAKPLVHDASGQAKAAALEVKEAKA